MSIQYIELILLDERESLNVRDIYTFLCCFFPRVSIMYFHLSIRNSCVNTKDESDLLFKMVRDATRHCLFKCSSLLSWLLDFLKTLLWVDSSPRRENGACSTSLYYPIVCLVKISILQPNSELCRRKSKTPE